MKRTIVSGIVTGAAVGMAVLVAVGCEDKKNGSLAPAASSLGPSTTPPQSASTKKFAVDPASGTSFVMDAPKEKIKAVTTAGAGSLDVDLANLASSRGEVKIDLTTLTMKHWDDPEKNASQTTDARTWLEVGDGVQGKLEDKVKEQHRYAVYAIRSIENVAPSADVTKLPTTKDGGDDVRTVTMTTKGELLVHGHKVDRESDLEVQFRYDAGGAPDKPKGVAIKTKKPLRVVLAEHDVKPRDGFGKVAKSAFHLLGTKVADVADVTLDVRAKPEQ